MGQPAVSVIERIASAPSELFELANVLLTTDDAAIGVTPREVVWTHRGRRYTATALAAVARCPVVACVRDDQTGRRSSTFGRVGSLIEFLLKEGFDVFLVDWGVPDEEDADMGLEDYVCDELHWAVRRDIARERRVRASRWSAGVSERPCARCTAGSSSRMTRSRPIWRGRSPPCATWSC